MKPCKISIAGVKNKPFGGINLKFFKTWRNCPVSIVYEIMPKNFTTPHIAHKSTHEMVFILSGTATAFLNNKAMRIKKGDYLVIPAGVKHKIKIYGADIHALSIFCPPIDYKNPDAHIKK